MFLRKTFLAGLAFFGLAATSATAALSDDDFVEAAWITTRFYGAQRSGEGPNWLSIGSNYTTSFLKDNVQGVDVSGGWFDCGDHAMFGQPQSYASYVLALAYAEFTEGFYDLYTGDYSDYKDANDFSRKGGKPNKVRDLLEELRYEADFWVKAAIDEKTFVTVKGDGDLDHKKWVTPGKMSTLGTSEGGDPRPITATANDSYTPGLAAAMLAVMARVDPEESNRSKYLKAALIAYSYSKSHTGVSSAGSYYQSSWWGGRWQDGKFLAALELYRTTEDASYKTEAESFFRDLEFSSGSYTRFGYGNVVPLSVVMGEGVLDMPPAGSSFDTAIDYLNNLYKNESDANGVFKKETGGGGSFSVRTPAGGAFLYGLLSKFQGVSTYDEMIEKNMAYLLGDNGNKKSYVVGFDRNGVTPPPTPHHRGFYGNEDTGKDPDSGFNVPEKNKLLGGTIAGDFNSGSHNTTVSTWNVNEVCVDLNAPVVGALGYILSKKAPKTDVDLGIVPPTDALDKSKLVSNAFRMERNGGVFSIHNSAQTAFEVEVFDINGKILQSLKSDGRDVFFVPKAKGVLKVRVSFAKGQQIFTMKSF